MHVLVVGCELILASEAVACSMVLASDHKARELGGIVAMLGGSVAVQVTPTLGAEAAILDEAVKGGLRVFWTSPVMGLLMLHPILKLFGDAEAILVPRIPAAACKMT